ncbi:hypothetical protein [Alkalimarinus coralli]|nr:hypothetical protein [Alkalimarinus coralli]
MSEKTRQHYLTQMGVTLWYSRCELPGAAASPEFDFGANAESPHSGGGSSTLPVEHGLANNPSGLGSAAPKSAADILSALSSPSPHSSPSEATSALSNERAELHNTLPKEVSATQNTPQEAIAPDAHDVSVLNKPANTEVFSADAQQPSGIPKKSTLAELESLELMLWVGEKSWFISDNDAEFPLQLKQQLLGNIASALGENGDLGRITCFRWPFFGNQRLPGNDVSSMLDLLFEWIGDRVASDELNGFLMGEKITNILLQRFMHDDAGKELELNISDERGVKVISTLSLNDLLREPLKKRVAWQHLSPYRAK